MMPGVWAWTFVVLKRAPKVASSFANVSFRIGSSPGSMISRTRGTGAIIPLSSACPRSLGGQILLDRGQCVEQHVADDGQALRGDLVERVVGRVPRRIVEVDQQRGGHAPPPPPPPAALPPPPAPPAAPGATQPRPPRPQALRPPYRGARVPPDAAAPAPHHLHPHP